MMQKQKKTIFSGKQLSRKEMKNLKGGVSSAVGLWVCTKDYFDCYFTKGECLAGCSIPSRCRFYNSCP
jgi:uncharacterized cupin superfamily protein